jgi:predicted GNAT superfamily acetyltransferase
MLVIRSLKREDEAQVLSLNATALPHVAQLDAAELSRLRSLSKAHFVAVDDEALLGYALVFFESDAYDGEEFQIFASELSRPFTYVDQVVVLKSAWGSGVGRQLYEAIEKKACDSGHRWLCCEINTVPPNPGSLAFHRRLGFRILRNLATQDGRRVNLLKKSLPVAA